MKSFRKIAGLMILVLCFAVTFTVALTLGLNADLNIDDPTLAPVANAYDMTGGTDTKEGHTLGKASNAITFDKGELDATDFGFPGTNSSTTSWSVTDTFNNISLNENNHEVYRTASDKTQVFSTKNSMYFGVSNAAAKNYYMMLFNYNVSTFMSRLLDAGFTIEVSATMTLTVSDKGVAISTNNNNSYYIGIYALSGTKTAKEALDNDRDNTNYFITKKVDFNANNYNAGEVSTPKATLTKDNKKLAFAFGSWFDTRSGWLGISADREVSMKLTNFKATFTIKYPSSFPTSLNDGGKPYKAHDLYSGAYESYSPYVTNVAKMPVYYSSLSSVLTNRLDGTDSNGNAVLKSYTSQSITEKVGSGSTSTTYYKRAEMDFVDTYDYTYAGFDFTKYKNNTNSYQNYAGIGGYNAGATSPANNSSANSNRFSGIKTVTVTGTPLTIDGTANGDAVSASVDVSKISTPSTGYTNSNRTSVGNVAYVVVQKFANARVKVLIYARTNVRISIKVTDYGTNSCESTTEFQGIDTVAPTTSYNNGTNLELEGYVFNDANSLTDAKWFRKSQLLTNASSIKNNDTGAPYVWFYTVERKDTLQELKDVTPFKFSGYSGTTSGSNYYIKSYSTMAPISYNNIGRFTYDFVNGGATGLDGSLVKNPSVIGDRVTGAGYYRFNFYIVDMAGNLGSQSSCYVKVDYDQANYTFDFNYKVGNDTLSVLPSENGTKWATGETTLTFNIDNICFSGNTLMFSGVNNDDYLLVFDRTHLASMNGTAATDNKYTLELNAGIDSTKMYFAYAVEEYQVDGEKKWRGTITITFEGFSNDFNAYPNVALVSSFYLYTGEYTSSTVATDDSDSIKYINPDWKYQNNYQIHILIDRNIPDMPTLGGDTHLVEGVNDYSNVFEERNWKTDGYNLDLKLIFNDNIAGNDTYKSGIRVFTAIKNVRTLDDLNALKAVGIESNYRLITTENYNSEYSIDQILVPNMGELSNGEAAFPIEFLQSSGSGMRIIYIWVVDQAGNCSALNSYYVLLDAKNYTISSSVLENAVFGVKGSIVQTDAQNNSATVFHRGETVNFAISLEAGYVPYLFTKTQNENSTVLFENYTPFKSLTATSNPFAPLCTRGDLPGEDSNKYGISFVVDDLDNLGDLLDSSVSEISFQIAIRQVITRSITDRNKFYDTQALDITKYLKFNTEDAALIEQILAKYHFDFADSDGNPLDEAPISVGDYTVRIYIDRDDDTFVVDDDYDASGNYVVDPKAFSILQGRVVITATATSSVYGDRINLVYTVSGFDTETPTSTGETLVGSLKISGVENWSPDVLLSVSDKYSIVEDVTFAINDKDGNVSGNYTVEFNGATHTVTQRGVEILAWEEHKYYGNTDPSIRFGVRTDQFEWYTSKGAEFTLDNVLGAVFGTYVAMGEDTYNGKTYRLYNSGGRLTRNAGEAVGNYTYKTPDSAFEVGNNYVVTVLTDRMFVIDKREVVLDVSGQSMVIPGTQTPNPAAVRPNYALDAKDNTTALAAEIAAAVSGQLSVSTTGTEQTPPDGYSAMWEYAILLGTAEHNNRIETDNLIITLGDNAIYIIYVAGGDAVILNIKDNAVFGVVFGQTWTENLINYQAFKDNFVVTGIDASEFDDITWTFSIAGASFGSVISAGSHKVTIDNVKVMKDGVDINRLAFVDNFNLTVNPAEIVVRPTAENLVKVYGEADSLFGIGFEIVSVNGTTGGEYAGYTYEQLISMMSGAFARGRYAPTNEFRYLGNTYDDATDENGIIIKNHTGDFYSFTVSTAFSISDTSFTIVAELMLDTRFIINQKAINLDLSNFVGVNKAYDGTTSVSFGNTVAYDVTSELVRAQDDIKIVFEAEYDQIGSLEHPTDVGIVFSKLGIAGNDVDNYKLGIIVNTNSEGKLLENGKEVSSAQISDNVTATIYYIDNINNIDKIHISMGAIGIFKSDFEISKIYDNNNAITMSAVTIGYRKDEKGGSAMLNQIWKDGGARIEGNPTFERAEAGSYTVNITLFFALKGVTEGGIEIATDGAYYNPDVIIEIVNGEGIKVQLNLMPATIMQKVLGAKDFVSVTPKDQDYSSLARVSHTDFVLADGALAEGDSLASVGINLVTLINGSDYGFGVHSVSIAGLGDDQDATSVLDRNYTIDIDALNECFNDLKVTINKAKLMPNVRFVNKQYDGSQDVEVQTITGDYEYALTVLSYQTYLRHELEKFSISGAVEYKLSANGELNENVILKDGVAVAHNVMIIGLTIVEDGDKDLLKNYEIYGARYSESGYVPVGSIESGTVIDNYEMTDVVRVDRKNIQILANNVIIKEKVYNGDRNADIRILLDGSGVVSGHEELLSVTATGTFAKSTVGEKIPINISDVKLIAKEGNENLLNNYVLQSYTERRTANIVPRPVSVTVNLGEKTYNGSTQISNNSLSFSLGGILDNEAAGYAVQAAGGAFYVDKNVNLEKDDKGNIKDFNNVLPKKGTIYNPILRNNRGQVNYMLAMAQSEKDGEDYIAFVDENGTLHYGEKYDGKGSVIYYYALPYTDKYIDAADNEKLMTAYKAGAIVGHYLYGATWVYTVVSDYEGEVTGSMPALTYVKGLGKILKKNVSISANAIVANPNSTAYTKMYDGTKKFYGIRGDSVSNGDYYYNTSTGIVGVIEGDNVRISEIKAEFDTAHTTANYVVFTPSGIEGEDAYNYSFDGAVGSARKTGSITKRTIDAVLEDATMEYGTAINTVVGNIVYRVYGNDGLTYKLDLWESGFFLALSDYAKMMGGKMEDYKEIRRATLYTKNTVSGYDIVPEGVELGSDLSVYYIKLSGITSLPTVKATFKNYTPNAGEVSESYTINNVVVNNYVFHPVYTDVDSSKLTVVKKDLFISANGKSYVKEYAGNDPAVEIFYLDKNGNNGFAYTDTDSIVFKADGVDYTPVVKWGVFNPETKEWNEISKYAVISDDLAAHETYAARFFAPDGTDYDTVVKNYNVHLGDGLIMNNGTVILTYGGYKDMTTDAACLKLVQPTMSGVSLHTSANSVYTETYTGSNMVANILNGIQEGDETVIVDENGNETVPVNADTYVGYVRVRRAVKVDDNDPNTYNNIWTSSNKVTLIIGKASPQLAVISTTKTYDGKTFVYGVSGANNMITYLHNGEVSIRDGYADISYEIKNDKEEFVPVDELRNAGVYRVTVKLNSRFAENNPNYLAETVTATYNILKATVNVSISTEGYEVLSHLDSILKLGATYDQDKTYDIDYSVSMQNAPEDIILPKAQTTVKFERDIVSSGRYPFAVVITDGKFDKNNYRLVNNNGVLELTTKQVANENGSVTLDENEVVANRLVAKKIVEGVASGTDLDLWTKVNNYMPYIDKNAKLASVVRLELYYDNNYVDLDGESMQVSVAIPEEVGKMDGKAVYVVTRDGTLKRLTDYTITEDGKIEYTTDHLGSLVFVDLHPRALELWQIIAISVAAGIVAIAIIWTIVALAVRKSQLKKLM